MHKRVTLLATLFGLLVLAIGLAGCSAAKSGDSNGKIKIIASTDFYAEVAKDVAGDKGTVTSIINNPSVDPHSYEPTTAVAKNVSSADIIIANGIGYDPWLNKLAKNSNGKLIKVGENVMNLKSGANPHIWYNPKTMPKLANYIAAQLAKKQPKNKAYFEANAKKYIKSLQPISAKITEIKSLAASGNRDVYVSEPVYDYALDGLGFTVKNKAFEHATESETDPSAQSIKDMQTGIENRQIRFFVNNKQVSSKTVTNMTNLAKQSNVPVLNVTETKPSHMSYKQWMLAQYTDLENILKSNQ